MKSEYEYKTAFIKMGMSKNGIANNIQTQINETAQDGWDLFLTAAEGAVLIFRRKLPPAE